MSYKSRERYLNNKKENREVMKRKVFKYIEKNPRSTKYSTSRNLKLPLSTVQNVIEEMINDDELGYNIIPFRNNQKKELFIITSNDLIPTIFDVQNLLITTMQQMLLRSLYKGKRIQISAEKPQSFEPTNDPEKLLQEIIDIFKNEIVVFPFEKLKDTEISNLVIEKLNNGKSVKIITENHELESVDSLELFNLKFMNNILDGQTLQNN